jgi:hypothetical protein
MLTARLHPLKLKKGGEVYSVIFRGELLVECSNDPECDAARALLAKASPANSPCSMARPAGPAP